MKWTNNEIEILKEHYSTTAKHDLVEIFRKTGRNRTWLSIFKKANKLGLKKITHKEAIDKILREKYSNTALEVLIKEVQKYLPYITKKALIMRANRLGLNRRKYAAKVQQKKIKIPQPSKELAWFLGVLAGDGYVSSLRDKSKTYKASLTVVSEEFVNQFSKIGKVLFGIQPRLRKYNKYKLKGIWRKYYECTFVSKAMVNFLGDWRENVWFETLTNRFNWIWDDKSNISAFLGGFFDSDGSIIYNKEKYVRRVSFAVLNKNAQTTIEKMLEELGIKCHVYWKGIQIDGKENVKKFAMHIESCISGKKRLLNLVRLESWKTKSSCM